MNRKPRRPLEPQIDGEQAARIESLIERLLTDAPFRSEFRRDPVAACHAIGLDTLGEELRADEKAMRTLEIRESKSSLAGVVMAVAAEAVGVAELQGLLGHRLHDPAHAAVLNALKAHAARSAHGGRAAIADASAVGRSSGGVDTASDATSQLARSDPARASALGHGASPADRSSAAAAGVRDHTPAPRAPTVSPREDVGGPASHAAGTASSPPEGVGLSGALAGRVGQPKLAGRISWFGGPNDPSAGNATASGAPITHPGIAVYNRDTLGGYWLVRMPNGQQAILQQTDIGPAPWTGRKIDFTYSSLSKLGYTEHNFPTDATASATYLGKSPPPSGDIGTAGAGAGPAGIAEPAAPTPHGAGGGDAVAAPGASSVAGVMSGAQSAGPGSGGVAELLASSRLSLPADVRAVFSQGGVDRRLVAVLESAVAHHRVVVGRMESVVDPVHAQAVEIVSVDGQPVGPGNVAARDLVTELAALDPSVRPSEIGTPWAIQAPGFFTDPTHQDRLRLAFGSELDYQPGSGGAGVGGAAAEASAAGAGPSIPGSPAAAGAAAGPAPAAASAGPAAASPAAAGAAHAAGAAIAAEHSPVQPLPNQAGAVAERGHVVDAAAGSASGQSGAAAADVVGQAAITPPHGADFGSPTAHAAFEAAKSQLGVRYQWGGTSPQTGFDCSGLMQWAYGRVGIKLPRVAEDQFHVGTPEDLQHLREGDLVFFHDSTGYIHHVGMYVGNHKFLEAPHTGDVVKYADLREPYWQQQFAGGKRIVPLAEAPRAAARFAAAFVPHGGQYGFFPAPGKDYSHGDEPEIAARLDTLGKSLKLRLVGISGYRTPEHSVAVGGFANDPHTRGEASDTPGIEQVQEATLRRFGLTRPFAGAAEADHIQLAPGTRGAARPAIAGTPAPVTPAGPQSGASSGMPAPASTGAQTPGGTAAPSGPGGSGEIMPESPPQPGTAVFRALKRQERSFERHTVKFLATVQPDPGSPLYGQGRGGQRSAAAQVMRAAADRQSVGQGPAIGLEPASSGSMSVASSLLTSGQERFTARLAELTGLDPKVIAAWALAEESGGAAQGREAAKNFNWLNIGYFDSGAGRIAFDKAFGDPLSAAEQTARFLKGKWGGASSSIRAILSSVGASPEQQINAIAGSDWAASHYGGGDNLRGTYKLLADLRVTRT